jgi:hypothetical protein
MVKSRILVIPVPTSQGSQLFRIKPEGDDFHHFASYPPLIFLPDVAL